MSNTAQRAAPARELAPNKAAGHLFEEPGTLAEAAQLARDWFDRYLLAPYGGRASDGAR